MIFVTVGTHEQQFNRLISEIDDLKGKKIIKEDVFIQTGFSTYKPKNCEWSKMVSYEKMQELNSTARIVITHGGPASFIAPLQLGKIPIVVPRQFELGEHVNNHQVEFAKAVSERMGNIIPVFDITELGKIISDYDNIVKSINKKKTSNNEEFCKKINTIIENLF